LAGYEAEEKRVRDNLTVEALIKERAESKGMAKGREEGMAKREQEIVKTLLSQPSLLAQQNLQKGRVGIWSV
jgi:hypothetical protein